MKYLNANKEKLFAGNKVTYRGKVYWANMTTREIYCHSIDEEIIGSISGYKVADITDEWVIVKPRKGNTMPLQTTIWQAKYDAAHTVQIHLKLNTETDKDILNKLKQVESKQGYIKQLIRKDIGSRPE